MPTLTDRGFDWIGQQKKDQPFFLYFPFTSPHAPIVPTPEFVGKSKANGFGDFVVQTDDAVGRVLQALREHGLEENTLVIFSADNGPEQYAYARLKNFDHRSSGPLRGLKRDLWEGGHRVPTIMRWPGQIPAGTVNDGLLSQIDFYATIAQISVSKFQPTRPKTASINLPCCKAKAKRSRHSRSQYERKWIRATLSTMGPHRAKTGAVSKVPECSTKPTDTLLMINPVNCTISAKTCPSETTSTPAIPTWSASLPTNSKQIQSHSQAR